MNKLLITLLIGLLFISISCNKNEVEIPEYEKYDWYAHYIIEGEEHTITKNGTDTAEPYLNSFESFAFSLNPDSTVKEVLAVYLETGIQTTSVETDSIMWFGYIISTQDKDLIAARGKSREERVNALVTYFTNRQFLSNTDIKVYDEIINLGIADKFGNTYKNKIFSNGTYIIILDYDIKVKKVQIVEHEKYGQVVKVLMHINATVNDEWYGQDRTLTAEVQTFFLPPFED